MLIICQIDWREVGVAFELQCLRNCTLSSLKLSNHIELRKHKNSRTHVRKYTLH